MAVVFRKPARTSSGGIRPDSGSLEPESIDRDLVAMGELAASLQPDHRFHIIYLGENPESITADLAAIENWADTAYLAEQDGRIIGWLVAELDIEMGRVWWLGPFVAADHGQPGREQAPSSQPRSSRARWDWVADELYQRTKELLPAGITEEELAFDDRSGPLRGWCSRHNFVPNTASVLLRLAPDDLASPDGQPLIRPVAEADHDVVAALHEHAFPGTHTTAEALFASNHPRLVLEAADSVVGYVAFEMQSDGSGYVDYLAVADDRRGAGYGAALVAGACRQMIAEGADYVHLTVREDNAPARALYARLGFVEERLARPYRIGFDLG